MKTSRTLTKHLKGKKIVRVMEQVSHDGTTRQYMCVVLSNGYHWCFMAEMVDLCSEIYASEEDEKKEKYFYSQAHRRLRGPKKYE